MPLDNQIDLKSGRDLKPLLLEGEAREQEIRKAQSLHRIPLTSRESSDLIVRAKK
jgi:sulfate adenylyltransferase